MKNMSQIINEKPNDENIAISRKRTLLYGTLVPVFFVASIVSGISSVGITGGFGIAGFFVLILVATPVAFANALNYSATHNSLVERKGTSERHAQYMKDMREKHEARMKFINPSYVAHARVPSNRYNEKFGTKVEY